MGSAAKGVSGVSSALPFFVATAGLRDAKSGNDAPEIEGAPQPQDA